MKRKSITGEHDCEAFEELRSQHAEMLEALERLLLNDGISNRDFARAAIRHAQSTNFVEGNYQGPCPRCGQPIYELTGDSRAHVGCSP